MKRTEGPTNRARRFGHGKIEIRPMSGRESVVDLVNTYYNAYNAARVREICHLLENKVLKPRVTVGLSLSGALIPAGLGSCLIPMIENGFIDYIVSTGANLYHDTHFGLGYDLFKSSPFMDDVELYNERVIRIYDITFDLDVLLGSDKWVYTAIDNPEFQMKMGTSELHYKLGGLVDLAERQAGRRRKTLLGAAYRAQVPIYTSSPGDSTIGLNMAARALVGGRLEVDVSRDVNESTALVYNAKKTGSSAVIILGGGSPKNFILQTEPQLQEVLGIDVNGHDYYMQVTDARPDTGGLSGATPGEAVSWGKVDPKMLPDSVVGYGDSTLIFPIIASYVLTRCRKRPLKRLYVQRDALLNELRRVYEHHLTLGKRAVRRKVKDKKRKR